MSATNNKISISSQALRIAQAADQLAGVIELPCRRIQAAWLRRTRRIHRRTMADEHEQLGRRLRARAIKWGNAQ